MTNSPVAPIVVSTSKLAWVDTETTGLNASAHRVIDLCVILTDAHLNILEEFSTRIALSPVDLAAFDPIAKKVNGYTDELWKDAPPNAKWIWERVHEMTNGHNLYGQNVAFDEGFLSAEMKRWGITKKWDRRLGDTALLSQRAWHVYGAPNAKLETSYPALGGPPLPGHRARPDVLRAMYLYDYLLVSKDGLSEGKRTDKHFSHLLREEAEKFAAEQAVATQLVAV